MLVGSDDILKWLNSKLLGRSESDTTTRKSTISTKTSATSRSTTRRSTTIFTTTQKKILSEDDICSTFLRDIGNALDNHRICQRVLENGQYLDWLRDNRNLCEKSADHYTQFTESNCGPMFCDQFRGSLVQWRLDYQSQCKDISRSNIQECKNLENNLKAFKYFNC